MQCQSLVQALGLCGQSVPKVGSLDSQRVPMTFSEGKPLTFALRFSLAKSLASLHWPLLETPLRVLGILPREHFDHTTRRLAPHCESEFGIVNNCTMMWRYLSICSFVKIANGVENSSIKLKICLFPC